MSFQPRWRSVMLLLAFFANDATHAVAGEQAALDVLLTDASGPIRVSVGQALRIHLPASRAMGYEWVLEEGVPPWLRLETDPGEAPASGQHWMFRAERSGHATLHFAYRRPWEVRDMPARTARFDIMVR